MSLVSRIEELDIFPRHQGDEYEYTSDFIEWFYDNLVLNTPTDETSILYRVTQDRDFPMMQEQCLKLMNVNYTKLYADAGLISIYRAMKHWLLDVVDKYEVESPF